MTSPAPALVTRLTAAIDRAHTEAGLDVDTLLTLMEQARDALSAAPHAPADLGCINCGEHAEALARRRLTSDDAPEAYSAAESEAWASGYNDALYRWWQPPAASAPPAAPPETERPPILVGDVVWCVQPTEVKDQHEADAWNEPDIPVQEIHRFGPKGLTRIWPPVVAPEAPAPAAETEG